MASVFSAHVQDRFGSRVRSSQASALLRELQDTSSALPLAELDDAMEQQSKLLHEEALEDRDVVEELDAIHSSVSHLHQRVRFPSGSHPQDRQVGMASLEELTSSLETAESSYVQRVSVCIIIHGELGCGRPITADAGTRVRLWFF